jgi:hypothetical protein
VVDRRYEVVYEMIVEGGLWKLDLPTVRELAEASNGEALPQPTAPATPEAQGRMVDLRPACGKIQDAPSTEEITLRAYWGANGVELAQQASDIVDIAISLNGEAVESNRSPLQLSASEVPCGTELANSYWLVESASIGTLAAGEYAITLEYTFTEQLSDGYDSDEDGLPDSYGPGGDEDSVTTVYMLRVR